MARSLPKGKSCFSGTVNTKILVKNFRLTSHKSDSVVLNVPIRNPSPRLIAVDLGSTQKMR